MLAYGTALQQQHGISNVAALQWALQAKATEQANLQTQQSQRQPTAPIKPAARRKPNTATVVPDKQKKPVDPNDDEAWINLMAEQATDRMSQAQ